MKIVTLEKYYPTPKNYSRKITICSCQCPIVCTTLKEMKVERVMIKYEVEPNKEIHYIPKLRKNQWASYSYWGEFKKVTELPPIFSKLNESDFVVKIGSFTRDGIQMPFICEIQILNTNKYLKLKQSIERKNKLLKIKNI